MAGRRPLPPTTALGQAIRAHRGDMPQREAAPEVGIDRSTLAHLERGSNLPSLRSARAIAAWLGWSLEEVLDAAERPAEAD